MAIEYVYALHDFEPQNDDEIAFVAGERIEVLEKDDAYGDGWWTVRFRFPYISRGVLHTDKVQNPSTRILPFIRNNLKPENRAAIYLGERESFRRTILPRRVLCSPTSEPPPANHISTPAGMVGHCTH